MPKPASPRREAGFGIRRLSTSPAKGRCPGAHTGAEGLTSDLAAFTAARLNLPCQGEVPRCAHRGGGVDLQSYCFYESVLSSSPTPPPPAAVPLPLTGEGMERPRQPPRCSRKTAPLRKPALARPRRRVERRARTDRARPVYAKPSRRSLDNFLQIEYNRLKCISYVERVGSRKNGYWKVL